MKLSFSNLLAASSILVWATAWAATEKKAVSADTIPAAQGTAAEATKLYTEVSFDKGSAAVSDADRQKIQSLVNGAKQIGKVSEVRVLTWSDASYPAAKGKKLSDAQRELADQRNETIKSALNDADLSVSTYNMAEKPSALSNLFQTSDAKVKRAMNEAGLQGKKANHLSKSMILVIMDN